MYVPRSRTQTARGARRTQEAARILRTLSLAAVLLLMTLALGCTDSVPTAVEDHATPEAAAAATLSKGKPTDTGIITRATFTGASVCGIPVTTEFFRAGAEWENPLPGHPPLKETGSFQFTFTAANGKTVQLHRSGQFLREITEWIDDRTFRATETVMGAPLLLKTPNGPVLLHDVGRIVIGNLIQLQEGGGFEILEVEILEISGPHPEAESGFAALCAVVTDALT